MTCKGSRADRRPGRGPPPQTVGHAAGTRGPARGCPPVAAPRARRRSTAPGPSRGVTRRAKKAPPVERSKTRVAASRRDGREPAHEVRNRCNLGKPGIGRHRCLGPRVLQEALELGIVETSLFGAEPPRPGLHVHQRLPQERNERRAILLWRASHRRARDKGDRQPGWGDSIGTAPLAEWRLASARRTGERSRTSSRGSIRQLSDARCNDGDLTT